ncbi:hypothetical protein IV203_014148 [Nitzschia inconspicua]|uniref:Uncharacterized protein n=1 Tax=Nitzschia inconspicua TaxID=303405 RepID=A0A9K3M6M4_9STRA|nr:hypothetical protein IV203_014148 [Nitzschia inconspicua]
MILKWMKSCYPAPYGGLGGQANFFSDVESMAICSVSKKLTHQPGPEGRGTAGSDRRSLKGCYCICRYSEVSTMRFFNRRKKISPESYYDYYEDHGVIPKTMEYYLEYGQEVEAQDFYWDIPNNDTVQGTEEDREEDDDGSTAVSFVPD